MATSPSTAHHGPAPSVHTWPGTRPRNGPTRASTPARADAVISKAHQGQPTKWVASQQSGAALKPNPPVRAGTASNAGHQGLPSKWVAGQSSFAAHPTYTLKAAAFVPNAVNSVPKSVNSQPKPAGSHQLQNPHAGGAGQGKGGNNFFSSTSKASIKALANIYTTATTHTSSTLFPGRKKGTYASTSTVTIQALANANVSIYNTATTHTSTSLFFGHKGTYASTSTVTIQALANANVSIYATATTHTSTSLFPGAHHAVYKRKACGKKLVRAGFSSPPTAIGAAPTAIRGKPTAIGATSTVTGATPTAIGSAPGELKRLPVHRHSLDAPSSIAKTRSNTWVASNSYSNSNSALDNPGPWIASNSNANSNLAPVNPGPWIASNSIANSNSALVNPGLKVRPRVTKLGLMRSSSGTMTRVGITPRAAPPPGPSARSRVTKLAIRRSSSGTMTRVNPTPRAAPPPGPSARTRVPKLAIRRASSGAMTRVSPTPQVAGPRGVFKRHVRPTSLQLPGSFRQHLGRGQAGGGTKAGGSCQLVRINNQMYNVIKGKSGTGGARKLQSTSYVSPRLRTPTRTGALYSSARSGIASASLSHRPTTAAAGLRPGTWLSTAAAAATKRALLTKHRWVASPRLLNAAASPTSRPKHQLAESALTRSLYRVRARHSLVAKQRSYCPHYCK
eukprot:gene24454-10053_t